MLIVYPVASLFVTDMYDDDDYDQDYDGDYDYQLFLTVPFVGASHALPMLEFKEEDRMAGGLDKRLGKINEDRESLCEKVVAEVRQWDDNRIIQPFPHFAHERWLLQKKADACTEYIDDFVAVHQPKSNHEGKGSPSHNSDPPSLYPKIAGAPEQGARDETKPPHLEASQDAAVPSEQGKPEEPNWSRPYSKTEAAAKIGRGISVDKLNARLKKFPQTGMEINRQTWLFDKNDPLFRGLESDK